MCLNFQFMIVSILFFKIFLTGQTTGLFQFFHFYKINSGWNKFPAVLHTNSNSHVVLILVIIILWI